MSTADARTCSKFCESIPASSLSHWDSTSMLLVWLLWGAHMVVWNWRMHTQVIDRWGICMLVTLTGGFLRLLWPVGLVWVLCM